MGTGGELILLGTGTGVPSLSRSSSSSLLRWKGLNIVVDFGPGTLRRLLEIGIDYNHIDLILITHTHPDHVSDLIPFLFATRYFSNPRRRDLRMVGGAGLKAFLEELDRTFKGCLLPDLYKVDIEEVERYRWEVDGLILESHPVRHREESLGFRVVMAEKVVAFSGDAGYSRELIELARGADLFICECSVPDGMEVGEHLTPSQAGMVAGEAGVERLVLTHFYPDVEGVPIVELVRRYFDGEVMLGKDLMRLL